MALLDTNAVLWMAGDQEQVSAPALTAMREARLLGRGLSISSTTLWEIALLASKGKLSFSPSVDVFLEKLEASYHVLPLTRQIVLAGTRFSGAYPKDPADRQIGATALIHGLPFITADRHILASGEVPCIW